MTWGLHFSPTPGWFDPTELAGTVTSYHTLYALHDAMIRPSPGQPMSPSLAEAWSASPDGLVYEFVLRKGVKFHNGESVSAEDVRFSFERYRGNAHKMLKEKVASIEIPDPARVRFRLKQPWPDFMTFYSSATGAGWIVPKKYVEKVDETFKKAIGAGPTDSSRSTRAWNSSSSVRRVLAEDAGGEAAVFVDPDEATRLAALKRGKSTSRMA
jgi:peptide/nickel transport system substrate-binding protein